MAAASSSSSSRFAYHVFLSFRGEDTRRTFTDCLYTALMQAGFNTFRDDDEIACCQNINSELEKAITESKISIIVFSKNYACSRWCLDELVMILERRRTSKHEVLPVFYDVDPSDVRNQRGTYAQAFAGHERILKAKARRRNDEWMEKVKRWREALKEAADLAGIDLQNQADGYWSKFIQKIVSVAEDKLNRTSAAVEPFLVGIYPTVKNINMWLRKDNTDVGMLVMSGMGGIGKTTIAKFVYDSNFRDFDGSSFLAEIREVSKQPDGLVRLQRQVLSNILNVRKNKIFNVDEGFIKIKDALSSKRILLVLDDVDQVDQVDAILGMRDWFCPGSKIIITTRNINLLKAHEVYKVYKLETLNNNESFELFTWHAFGKDYRFEGYEEHSRSIVHHCGGLPLALKVLGSSLSGKSIDVWKSTLEKLKQIPDAQILRKLKISFDSLDDDNDQNVFLHIACFFIGKDTDCTVKILDGCDLYTGVGIQSLIDRCLLTIDHSNKIMMHQLLRDMGREIVRQESPKEPGKRSRLWHNKDSFNVLRQKAGSEKIEGLVLDMHAFKGINSSWTKLNLNKGKKLPFPELFDESLYADQGTSLGQHALGLHPFHQVDVGSKSANDLVLETTAIGRMRNLRLLQLSFVPLSGSYEKFPKELTWLCWRGFPLDSIPIDFPVENLVSLDMRYSNLIQVWKDVKFLGLLKMLNLSHCHSLAKTPDFWVLPILERLILKDCRNLFEVDESIGKLERLVLLNLKDCRNLRKLPQSIHMLKSLETLNISGCKKLNVFPTQFRMLESLKSFAADGISIHQLLPTAGEIKSEAFSWSLVRRNPENLWASLPRSLRTLSLVDCNLSEDAFPRVFGNLSLLQNLNLSKNPLRRLPDCIRALPGLQKLQVNSCTMLQLVEGLTSVRDFECFNCTSLERVTFDCHALAYGKLYDIVEFLDFLKSEPLREVDREMISILGLPDLASLENAEVGLASPAYGFTSTCAIQGVPGSGIFSTFYPGWEVPSGFIQRSMGSSITFIVHSLPDIKIQGMKICYVYAFSQVEVDEKEISVKIRNNTKDKEWLHDASCWGVPEEDGYMVWLSYWMISNQLDDGDEVSVSLGVDVGFEVKECGINLVYEKKLRPSVIASQDTEEEHVSEELTAAAAKGTERENSGSCWDIIFLVFRKLFLPLEIEATPSE